MDSGSIANFFIHFGYLMDQTIADELFGFGTLVLIGVGGLAISVHTLIKHWNDPPPGE